MEKKATSPEENAQQQTPNSAACPEQPPKKKRYALYVCIGAAVILAAILLTVLYIIPESGYKKAAGLYAAGQYAEAQAAYEALGSYKDSPQQAAECVNAAAYGEAEKLYSEGRYAEAQAAFETLGSYRDSAARAEECHDSALASSYSAAVSLMEKGRYEEAQAAFEALGDYRDSGEKAIECAREKEYLTAVAFYEQGDYEKAVEAFLALGSYKDSPEQVLKAKYGYVKLHEDSSDALTRSYLPELADRGYEDSKEIFERLLNEVTVTEYTNGAEEECICASFCLLPGETVTAVLPAAEDITYTNEGSDWLVMSLEIPKYCYYPHVPLSDAEHTVRPKLEITAGDTPVRSLALSSFALVFPTAELQIDEPADLRETGVLCEEGNTLRIRGSAGKGTRVTVNGKAVELNEEGRFETVWTLSGTEAEQIIVTASGDDLVTASVVITALPHMSEAADANAEYAEEAAAEPVITFIPEGSEMFKDPLSVTVICPDAAFVYAGTGEEYTRLATVCFGDKLDVLGVCSGWFLVEYRENAYGWLSGAFCFDEWMFESGANPALKDIPAAENYLDPPRKYTLFAENGAVMRISPDTVSTEILTLKQSDVYVCIGYEAGWYLCCYNGCFGWIDENDLS